MKSKIILFLLLPLLTMFTGCASTGGQPVTNADVVKFVNKHQAIIADGVKLLRRVIIRKVISDTAERDNVNAQITGVATQLQALLDRGDFDPDSVRSTLKVKEEWVSEGLDVLSTAYSIAYADLDKIGEAQSARAILEAIVKGLAGTPAVVKSDKPS